MLNSFDLQKRQIDGLLSQKQEKDRDNRLMNAPKSMSKALLKKSHTSAAAALGGGHSSGAKKSRRDGSGALSKKSATLKVNGGEHTGRVRANLTEGVVGIKEVDEEDADEELVADKPLRQKKTIIERH